MYDNGTSIPTKIAIDNAMYALFENTSCSASLCNLLYDI